ncbi:class I SAM-dependent methyltransferase [Mycobacteroides abscessus]|uniref:class I SAM-dependent methyltransferase n=1 Tax=Mycobacteroides abscessus TaxID=36809 RepID=UPI00311A5CED
MSKLTPKFSDVQAHYDLSDDFFALFLDPSRTYSCAYFEPETLTLEQAQQAKIDLALGKLNLEPGMTLLDVGCGWGSTMKRALEHYDVNVIGLTLSKNQFAYVNTLLDSADSSRNYEVRLAGWEEFEGTVDRIVSIGAFEHFGHERYDSFFAMAHRVLPSDGKMLLHTIVSHHPDEWKRMGIPLLMSRVRFIYFIGTEILPQVKALLASALGIPEREPVHRDESHVILTPNSLTDAQRAALGGLLGAEHVSTDHGARLRHSGGKSPRICCGAAPPAFRTPPTPSSTRPRMMRCPPC